MNTCHENCESTTKNPRLPSTIKVSRYAKGCRWNEHPLSLEPLATDFSQQVQSALALHHSATKFLDKEPTKNSPADARSTRRWHLARHVLRSGLIFGPKRCASDSIVPLLLKSHDVQLHARTTSIDSALMSSSFANFIDYLASNDSPRISIMKRSRSDTSACIQRNRFSDMIAQYEAMVRHLDNYNKFTAEHPLQAPTVVVTQDGAVTPAWNVAGSRQAQSLSRHAGRNFTDFILNDLLLSTKTAENDRRRGSMTHTASQTDLSHMGEDESNNDSHEPVDEQEMALKQIGGEEPSAVLSSIQVIVTNSPVERQEEVREFLG